MLSSEESGRFLEAKLGPLLLELVLADCSLNLPCTREPRSPLRRAA